MLRAILAFPFALAASLARALAEWILGQSLVEPPEVIDGTPETWNELGLAALGLFAAEADRRGLELEPEVVETRLDLEGRKVTILFRRQTPTEAYADINQAAAALGNFRLAPRLAAQEAAAQAERNLASLAAKARGG